MPDAPAGDALTEAVAKALRDHWDNYEECSCADDPDSTCWYHLSERDRMDIRAAFVVEAITEVIQAARAEGTAEEREACARACVEFAERRKLEGFDDAEWAARRCAEDIRARSPSSGTEATT